MSRRDTPALAPRLDALGEAAELAAGRLPEDVVAGADAVVRAAGERQALSAEHTVVGFFGATGSGKSSLFNALTGRDLARVAATRPTTSEPLAAVWGVGRGQGLDPDAEHAVNSMMTLLHLDETGKPFHQLKVKRTTVERGPVKS